MGQRKKKRKNLSPERNRTYDLLNTGQALYPLKLRKTHGERGHILGSYLTRVEEDCHDKKIETDCNCGF